MHLSELHGAATHLAVVAIPLYALVVGGRRLWNDSPLLVQVEPWLLGGAVAGVAAAGATGLLVKGEAETELRGNDFTPGSLHFWLGIAIAVVVIVPALLRLQTLRRRNPPGLATIGIAAVALMAVFAQGYLGGRMTYDQGVGVAHGGEFSQAAKAVRRIDQQGADGMSEVDIGRAAFQNQGFGCASCHGNLAHGLRGPELAGGRKLDEFRRVHAGGLFPPSVVSDRDFASINAWLRTLRRQNGRRRDG
jgi:mono/diheme cytochrome c family protein